MFFNKQKVSTTRAELEFQLKQDNPLNKAGWNVNSDESYFIEQISTPWLNTRSHTLPPMNKNGFVTLSKAKSEGWFLKSAVTIWEPNISHAFKSPSKEKTENAELGFEIFAPTKQGGNIFMPLTYLFSLLPIQIFFPPLLPN